jgi:menaquinone-dependent protoporphyrinogen oxidase
MICAMAADADHHASEPTAGGKAMRVLVTAASRHGATWEIAEAISRGLARRGIDAEARPVERLASLDGYEAFVIGSAVYVGRWLEPARDLVEVHGKRLAEAPVWLFSSGPLGPPDALKPEGDPVDAAGLIETTRAVDHRVFAGRLDRKLLRFGEKAVAVAVRAPEGDFRDWDAIDGFAGEIAERLARV